MSTNPNTFDKILENVLLDCSATWTSQILMCLQEMSGGTAEQKMVTCTVKPAIHLQIGEAKSDTAQSGVSVVDVMLPFGKTINVSKDFTDLHCAPCC